MASVIQLLWLPSLLHDFNDQRDQSRRLAELVKRGQATKADQEMQPNQPIDLLLGRADSLSQRHQKPVLPPDISHSRDGGSVILNSDKFIGLSRQEARQKDSPVVPIGSLLNRDSLGILRPIMRDQFSPAELLGGPLTLASLDEAPMPVLARSERQRWLASGDPLAPLNSEWREPMRRAIRQLAASGQPKAALPVVQHSKTVFVPSTRIRKSEQVPVAIHADGTVQVLRRPAAAGALRDIEDWSQRQTLPEPGKVVATVIHLDPLPAQIQRSAAASTPTVFQNRSQQQTSTDPEQVVNLNSTEHPPTNEASSSSQ
ncbi:hypothetical protein KQ313_00640 [Synechococcus sp. CS-1325]|uniref:hypothetical protein n=1 Tax=Synechococcus sp. CS-1325 TaxID=2847979 RepID=UPI00223BF9FA|nr:hypothetical protein [Synechococcus sp. CS-1325]MCT0198200.1 hypothetical protein [Synechococcus sp. CS-1325]